MWETNKLIAFFSQLRNVSFQRSGHMGLSTQATNHKLNGLKTRLVVIPDL